MPHHFERQSIFFYTIFLLKVILIQSILSLVKTKCDIISHILRIKEQKSRKRGRQIFHLTKGKLNELTHILKIPKNIMKTFVNFSESHGKSYS